MRHFPDELPKGRLPQREYFFNVMNTGMTDYLQNLITHRRDRPRRDDWAPDLAARPKGKRHQVFRLVLWPHSDTRPDSMMEPSVLGHTRPREKEAAHFMQTHGARKRELGLAQIEVGPQDRAGIVGGE